MYSSGSFNTQKVSRPPAKSANADRQSRFLRPTLSSRAKQNTTGRDAVSSNSPIPKRGPVKAKPIEPIRPAGKTNSSENEHYPLRNMAPVKPARNATPSNVKYVFKRDAPTGAKGPSKLPQLTSAHRSRTPCTERPASSASRDISNLRSSQWQRNRTFSTLLLNSNPYKISKETSEIRLHAIEMGVQTNEKEILNHSLLVGDTKFLKPSQKIVDDIEKDRKDLRTKKLLKATRKFEAHSERQEEHLNDLKEYLEKSYVTKKSRKIKEIKDEEEGLFNSMDKFFQQELPQAESITDIKARIKRKEQELLNLFDNVQTTSRKTSC